MIAENTTQMSNNSDLEYTKLFQTVCEAPVNAPKEAFNLHEWVFTLSDKDYQTTARGHIAAGVSTLRMKIGETLGLKDLS